MSCLTLNGESGGTRALEGPREKEDACVCGDGCCGRLSLKRKRSSASSGDFAEAPLRRLVCVCVPAEVARPSCTRESARALSSREEQARAAARPIASPPRRQRLTTFTRSTHDRGAACGSRSQGKSKHTLSLLRAAIPAQQRAFCSPPRNAPPNSADRPKHYHGAHHRAPLLEAERGVGRAAVAHEQRAAQPRAALVRGALRVLRACCV